MGRLSTRVLACVTGGVVMLVVLYLFADWYLEHYFHH